MAFLSFNLYDNNSDFQTNQTFHQFHDLDTESLTITDYEWFPWSICNGCGMPEGNAYMYPSVHLVPSPIVGLSCAQIVETRFLELALSLLDFSPRKPLGTFSILPWLQISFYELIHSTHFVLHYHTMKAYVHFFDNARVRELYKHDDINYICFISITVNRENVKPTFCPSRPKIDGEFKTRLPD